MSDTLHLGLSLDSHIMTQVSQTGVDTVQPQPPNLQQVLLAYSDGLGFTQIARPAVGRGWMETCQSEFSERQGAFQAANVFGWEVAMSCDVAIEWNGGRTVDDLVVRRLDPRADGRTLARSTYGEGVVTFDIGHSFVIPEDWNLLLTGPHNNPKRGISPLAKLLDKDLAGRACSISWMMTTVGTVVFEQGEAFCLLLPVPTSARIELERHEGSN